MFGARIAPTPKDTVFREGKASLYRFRREGRSAGTHVPVLLVPSMINAMLSAPSVARNLDALRAEYDLVIAEGAGSPVELNLKPRDIVNMRVASYAHARALLVGDIDAGGIFAALLATLMLLEADERALICGLIVNRFRGDPALFADGVAILEQRGGLPVLGVVPWVERLGIAEEDAVALERARPPEAGAGCVVAVVQIPAIANFDDFDPLAREPGVRVRFVEHPAELRGAAAAIVPGTKHTLAARRWLHERGFDLALRQFRGAVVGICGGYQILGQRISDPLGVEGAGGDMPGLGLLPVTTLFSAEKSTTLVHAQSLAPWAPGAPITAYEIHMGRTAATADMPALARITRRSGAPADLPDGCTADGGRVWGCYLHGIFANDAFRRGWLRSLGWQPTDIAPTVDPYDRLADVVEAHLDAERLAALLAT